MIEKIKKLQKSSWISALSDVRNLGLIVFGVIAVLVTWSGVRVVQTNYDLQKQISVYQQTNDLQKLENSNLLLSNKYLETDQYLELAARKQFNKANAGEKLLIVPESVALKYSVPITSEPEVAPQSIQDEGPWYERNFNAWMKFIFNKES